MKRFHEMTIAEKIKSMGSLNSMDHAVRLVGQFGGTVCGYNQTTVYTTDAGAFEWEERDGRVWPK
jgi:hypothetical protein